jgi:hypothetical protein
MIMRTKSPALLVMCNISRVKGLDLRLLSGQTNLLQLDDLQVNHDTATAIDEVGRSADRSRHHTFRYR